MNRKALERRIKRDQRLNSPYRQWRSALKASKRRKQRHKMKRHYKRQFGTSKPSRRKR